MKAKKLLVQSNQTGSFSNVKFMMNSDDFRLKDDSFGYTVLDQNPIYNHKLKTLTANNVVYKVFSDWSVKTLTKE
jgi:hypothetical protein